MKEKDLWDFLWDFKQARGAIFPELASIENVPATVPSVPFLDVRMVFYVEPDAGGESTALVNESLLKLWGAGVGEIRRIAMENARRLRPPRLLSTADTLAMIMRDGPDAASGAGCGGLRIPEAAGGMVALTNAEQEFGAACMAYEGVLEMCSWAYGPFYILPSSVHEVMIVPSGGAPRDGALMERLARMVRDRNRELNPREVLSGHAYFYNPERRAVEY